MSALERVRLDLVQVSAWRGGETALSERLRGGGWELPGFGRIWTRDGRLACSVRPQRWLLAAPAAGPTDTTLAETCGAFVAEAGAVIDLSAARGAWRITDPKARERLASGCRLDLDPTAFPPGRAAVTLIAQVPVMLACMDDGWLLMAPSSLAGHFEGWLHHALG